MIEIAPGSVNAKSLLKQGWLGNLTLRQSWLTLVISLNTEPDMAEDNPVDVENAVEPEVVESDDAAVSRAADGLGDLDSDDFDVDYDVDLSAAGRDALRGAAEGLKRAVSSGIRTVLAADETLRETLPRELPSYIQRQLEATRREVVVAIAEQTRTFLENIDLGGEMKRHLQEGRLEITTSIRFVADETSPIEPDKQTDEPVTDVEEST
jgi:hypothetical protein